MIVVESPLTAATQYPEWIKRGFDLLLSILLAVVVIPLGFIVACAVKLTSPGPALFRQQRVGKDGRLFWLYKFRSMYIGDSDIKVTAEGDSRITPLGKFLRRLKIDELPQLINVFKSEMSLVGPRPEVPEYVGQYTAEQREVLTVHPGITGLAQLEFRDEERLLAGRLDVKSFYLSEVMPRKLEIDRQYVRERTLSLDIKILLRTAVAVFRR